MKIENQVCTLEQAKRLQELGIEQSAFMSWCEALLGSTEHDEAQSHWLLAKTVGDDGEPSLTDMPDWWDDEDYGYNEVYSAFSVAELGMMLPVFTYSWRGRNNIYASLVTERVPHDDDFDYLINDMQEHQKGDSEAQARAAMLIHLLESGKVTAEECNQRLLSA